jgi:GNAT superfamily N-acetyltransferase
MEAPVLFRRADLTESDLVFRLHMDSVQTLCGGHYSRDQMEAWFVGRSGANYLSAIGQGALWLAERDSRAVGFTEFFPGLISMLFVAGECSGAGLGSQLLAFSLEGARVGAGTVRLESTLNAQTFYERHGFVEVGKSFLMRAGVQIPTVAMLYTGGSTMMVSG